MISSDRWEMIGWRELTWVLELTQAGFGHMATSTACWRTHTTSDKTFSLTHILGKLRNIKKREGSLEAVLFPNPLNIPIIMALDTLNQDRTLTCQVRIRNSLCLLTRCGECVVMAVLWSNQSLGMSTQSENEICFLSVSLCTHKYAHTPTCKVSHVESVQAVLIVHWGTQVAVKCLASGRRNEQTKQPERKPCFISVIIFHSLRAGFTTSSTTVGSKVWQNTYETTLMQLLSESLQLQMVQTLLEIFLLLSCAKDYTIN